VFAIVMAAGGAAQSPAPGDKADALAAAARKGDAAAVKTLLDEGVDVNTKFRYDATALSYAADRGHVAVVKLLLDRGADVNATDTFYHAAPLNWAVHPAMGRTPQHPEVVRLLLQRGARGKDEALRDSVSESDVATIQVILDLGGVSPATLTDALESATIGKHQDVVAMLERAGAQARVEFTMDPAQLARFAGTYSGSAAGRLAQASIVLSPADGRLIATLEGQRLTLLARDRTTFGVAERPGTIVTFRVEGDKPIAMTLTAMGNAIVFTRVEEK
jgi:hypothetical protein